ncbi:hypothetical protein K7432_011661, partial [Basidiobolus ranarum]
SSTSPTLHLSAKAKNSACPAQRRFPIRANTLATTEWAVCYFANAPYVPISEHRKYFREEGMDITKIINMRYMNSHTLEIILEKSIVSEFSEEVHDRLDWEPIDHCFKENAGTSLYVPFSLKDTLLKRFTSLLRNSPSPLVTKFMKDFYISQAKVLHPQTFVLYEEVWEAALNRS